MVNSYGEDLRDVDEVSQGCRGSFAGFKVCGPLCGEPFPWRVLASLERNLQDHTFLGHTDITGRFLIIRDSGVPRGSKISQLDQGHL